MYLYLGGFFVRQDIKKLIKIDDMKNKNTTTTLSLATYLSAIGFECVIDKQNSFSNQLTFTFNISKEEFVKLSNLFWAKKTTIDPLSYFEALKVLKSRIYQHQYQYKERNNERKSSS